MAKKDDQPQEVEDAVSYQRINYSEDEWWERLTLAQKATVSMLQRFGYTLAFIRSLDNGRKAVVLCDGKPAVIYDDGEFDLEPDIVLRK